MTSKMGTENTSRAITKAKQLSIRTPKGGGQETREGPQNDWRYSKFTVKNLVATMDHLFFPFLGVSSKIFFPGFEGSPVSEFYQELM